MKKIAKRYRYSVRGGISDSHDRTYVISFNNCPKKYFGETGRSVNTRINEHKRDVRNGNENNAIFLHIQNTQHSINWNNPRLVYKSSDFVRRRVVESTLINNFEI